MGGHGGLNILPQKSWNVYGRENRLKVARDEAQHAEEEKVRMEKQREAESQARRIYLLQQAAKKRGEHLELPPATAGPALALTLEPQQLDSSDSLQQPSAAAEQSAVAVREQEAQPALLQHINFFAEHEAREAHPEKLEEAKREARRRGDKKTQTSDAKFDEKFQVAHGLSGEASKPWYAKSGSMLQPVDSAQLQGSALGATPSQHRFAADFSSASRPALPARDPGSSDKHEIKAKKAARKEEKRRQHAEKAARREKYKAKGQKQGMDIERLRQERRDREKAERERARQAVLGDARSRGLIGGGKRYHGAYGMKAALKEAAAA